MCFIEHVLMENRNGLAVDGKLTRAHGAAEPLAALDLRHGENGLVSEDDTTSFAQAMVRLATDDALHARLLSGCKKSAQAITMEQMIERFANGIISALDMKPTIERNGTV